MVLQFVANWRKGVCVMQSMLIIQVSLLLLTGCSGSHKYEKQINKILDWEANNGYFSENLFDEVFEIIASDSNTLKYNFSDVNYMNVVDADDGNVRAYILESHGFGGNPSLGFDTRTLIQYRIGNDVYTYHMTDTYSVIEKVAKLDDNQYLFIAFYGSIAQGEHNHHQARVYRLDKSGVHQLTRVFVKDNYLEDEMEVYWEGKVSPEDAWGSTECYDEENYKDEAYCGIYYNEFNRTLYVSNTYVFRENDYGGSEVLDGTFRRYTWNDGCFKDVTIMGPYEAKNKDYYIRIEQNKDGSCTYKCWNGCKKSGKPNITIHGGKRELWDELGFMDYDSWISLDEYSPLGERYTFTNNGYVYQYMTGWYKGHMYEDLDVYNPQGHLIYSKNFEKIDLDL